MQEQVLNNNQIINSLVNYDIKSKISLMIDDITYNRKPTYLDVKEISNRMIRNLKRLTIEELANEIIKGKSFLPATLKSDNNYIRRTKDYWQSQQIVCLDFDNEIIVEINGEKVKQKHVTATLEQALADEFLINNAAFIYTTFSHTIEHPKFRVVFVLDRVIRDIKFLENFMVELLKKYPYADQSCKDSTRLYYGGKEIYEINYNNRLVVDDFPINIFDEGFCVTYISNVISSNISHQKPPTKQIQHNKQFNNIAMIKNNDIQGLINIVHNEPIQLDNMMKINNYIKSQDMYKLLGVNSGSIYDIFHDDNNPSATIYKSKSGHYLYKCFSSNNQFCGTIYDVVMRLQNTDLVSARNFLMDVYQIDYFESEQKRYLKEMIDEYKRFFINEDDLRETHPYIYKILGRYTKDIYLILDLAKEYITGDDNPRMMFYHSTYYLSEKLMTSQKSVSRRMNLFTLVDIIKKLRDEQIPKQLLKDMRKVKGQQKYKYRDDVYEIEEYPVDFLDKLESYCKYLSKTGFTMRSLTYEGLYRNYGEETARKVFVQEDKDKKFSQLSNEIISQIHMIVLTLINEKGWVTEDECLNQCLLYFKGQKEYKKDKFKQTLNEMLEGYDLERIRLNKSLKKQMNINDEQLSGYPFIIRQKNNLIEGANFNKVKQKGKTNSFHSFQ